MRAALTLVALALVLAACDTEGASLYDPDRQPLADPVLSDVSPAGASLAGIDILTLTGQNFSPVPANNLVYFGNVRGTVLEATPTMLRVRSPNTPGDAVAIRVAVLGSDGVGAEDYSNVLTYTLLSAATPTGNILRGEDVFGIASASGGGAYVSVFEDGRPDDIQLLGADGSRSVYFATTFPWSGLATGPDGTLYGARGLRAIFSLPEGGSQTTAGVAPNGFQFSAIAVGPDGTVWTGGDNTNGPDSRAIYRAQEGTAFTAFPFAPRVRDLIVFQDGLWVLAQEASGATKVWRFPISGGDLGDPVEIVTVFETSTGTAYALAAAADGTLYIGTDAEDPVLFYDGSTLAPLYPGGILTAPATGLAWGSGSTLYVVRGRRFNPSGDVIVTPTVIRVETRRDAGTS